MKLCPLLAWSYCGVCSYCSAVAHTFGSDLVFYHCRYFNAYDVASRYNLDFWVHLGDYVSSD